MNTATKGTGAAALIATGLVVTVAWALHQFANVEVPNEVISADTGLLTVIAGYFVHKLGAQE